MPVNIFTTIDDPLGTFGGTSAFGINDLGEIVGAYQPASDHVFGFVLSGGTYTALAPPSENGFTNAIGINASGQIVGQYLELGSSLEGFLLSGGTYFKLHEPSATTGTLAFGINNVG